MSSKLTTFRVVMLNANNVCYPGQILQGQVLIHVTADMKMKGIQVTCKGVGNVIWKAGNINSQGREEYVNVKVTVFGNASGEKGSVILPAGQHALPFELQLPPGIPASFEADDRITAYTRYWLSGEIDRAWKSNIRCKTYITMGSILDLNAIPGCADPVTKSMSKNTVWNGCFEEDYVAKHCCCCCVSEPLKVTLTLNKSGFVPGEAINIDTEIDNRSDNNVMESVLKLVMVVTLKATYGRVRGSYTMSFDTYKVLGRVKHGQVSCGDNVKYSRDLLHVPPVPPTGLPGCNVIDIRYFVRLAVHTRFKVLRIDIDTDITIGTVPLQADVERAQQDGFRHVIRDQPTASLSPIVIDLPPPSYRESVFGARHLNQEEEEERQAEFGTSSFAPAYTYYDWMSNGRTDELPSYETLFKTETL